MGEKSGAGQSDRVMAMKRSAALSRLPSEAPYLAEIVDGECAA